MNPGALDWLRQHYGVPARLGGRVRFIDTDTSVRYGAIVGADHHLIVRFDGEEHRTRLHPTWHVSYLDEYGGVVWPPGEGQP